MRIDPRRFFEFLFLLMLSMCLAFLYLHHMGSQRAGQLYREAARLADVPHVAELSPAPAPLEVLPETDAGDDAPAGMDLSPLREANADVVGWIEVPGLLSYPLLQGEDNAYYLSHAWNGEENAAGAIFLDYRASASLDGSHTLVYGHRMRDGTMFGGLKHYKDAAFWQENPSVTISNEDGVWQYDIYAAYETALTAPVYQQGLSSPEERQAFIQYGLERSAIDTGITPTAEDKIITLSTCSGSGSDTRWVVQAVRKQV